MHRVNGRPETVYFKMYSIFFSMHNFCEVIIEFKLSVISQVVNVAVIKMMFI